MRSVWARAIEGPARARGRDLPAILAALAIVAALACLGAVPAQAPVGVQSPTFRLSADQGLRPSVETRGPAAWVGGKYPVQGGGEVTVYVSAAYADDESAAQRWAGFFGRLIHGPELSRLTAYFGPLSEVSEACGSEALGCYSNDVLVAVGEPTDGVTPEEVATHEYGHHVAHNRANAPWRALDWGTKRWASHENVCLRSRSGSAFPGDEDGRYALNPGEAFAESYRVLNERRAGAVSFTWPIVDPSFLPDDGALAAVEQDVRTPWTDTHLHTYRVRLAGHTRIWRLPISTPLDGDLTARLELPPGAGYEVQLLDGMKVVSKGLWSGPRTQTLHFRVCGQRSLVLRVTRKDGSARFRVEVAAP